MHCRHCSQRRKKVGACLMCSGRLTWRLALKGFICKTKYNQLIIDFHMSSEPMKKHTGKCFDCEGQTELVEFDVKTETRIMQCQKCGLYHFLRKDFFGGWTLLKVSKMLNKE
jgi:hypothetical protein